MWGPGSLWVLFLLASCLPAGAQGHGSSRDPLEKDRPNRPAIRGRAGTPGALPEPAQRRLEWELDAESLGGRPVALAPSPLAGAAVVALGDGTIAGLEPASGSMLWAFASELEVSHLRTAGDRLLVAGSTRDDSSASSSRLLLCEPPEGNRVWLSELPHTVRFLDLDSAHVVAFQDSATIGVLELSSGRIEWQEEMAEPASSPPLLAPEALYLGTASGLEKRALVTGELLWRTPLSGSVGARPALLDDRILVGTASSRVVGLDTANGKADWSLDVGGPVMADLVPLGREVLAVTWANQLLCLKRNGHTLWRASVDGRVRQRPVLWRDSVLLNAERTPQIRLHKLDGGVGLPGFGLERWDEWLTSSPVVAGVHAIALTSRHRLVAFRLAASPQEPTGDPSD